MGLLTVIGVEIVRAIKNRKKDPELEYVQNTTLQLNDKEDFLYKIDILLKHKDKEGGGEFIDLYIEHNGTDEEIKKRVSTLNML